MLPIYQTHDLEKNQNLYKPQVSRYILYTVSAKLNMNNYT